MAQTDGSFPGFQTINDGLVFKYDGSGAQQWIRAIPSGGSRGVPSGVTTDSSGNICVVGDNTGVGGFILTVAKLDRDGTKLWMTGMGRGRDAEMTRAGGVAVDGDGNVLVTGRTNETFPGETNAGKTDPPGRQAQRR